MPSAVVNNQAKASIQVVPFRGTYTDFSTSTSATPNTSSQVAPANTERRSFFVQNLDATTKNVWINFGSAASATIGSVKIAPGAAWETSENFITTQAINIVSDMTSVAYTAKEGT